MNSWHLYTLTEQGKKVFHIEHYSTIKNAMVKVWRPTDTFLTPIDNLLLSAGVNLSIYC
jgi:hypothetical protein